MLRVPGRAEAGFLRDPHYVLPIPSTLAPMTSDRCRALVFFALAALLSGCATGGLSGAAPPVQGWVRTQFTMQHIDLAKGTGADAEADKCFYVHYTGWLTDGTKFDSSRDTASNGQPRSPLAFQQGKKAVIVGWDQGFEGMKVGGKRRLIIPYQLGYGVNGRPPVIPPKATLIFDVELMDVRDGPPPAPNGAPPARCLPWS